MIESPKSVSIVAVESQSWTCQFGQEPVVNGSDEGPKVERERGRGNPNL